MSNKTSLAVIECFGLIETFKILEIVSKNADLEFLGARKMSGGYIALGVIGELSYIQVVVERIKAMSVEKVRSVQAFPMPTVQMIRYLSSSKI